MGFTGKYVSPKVYDELEEITGLDRRTIQDYKTVSDRTSTVRHADLGFSHHREVAKLEPEKQVEFLQKASDEKLSVRELREEIRKADVKVSTAEMPSGKFRIVYADPPWKYGNSMPEYFIEQAKIKKFYLPIDDADKYCAKKYLFNNCTT